MPPPQTLVDCFWERLGKDADKPAVWTFAEQPRVRTWEDVCWDALSMAGGLRKFRLHSHDRIALVSANRVEWLVGDLAILLTDCVHVAIHTQLPPTAIAAQIRNSGAKLVLATSQLLRSIDPLLDRDVVRLCFGEESERITLSHWESHHQPIPLERDRYLSFAGSAIEPDAPATLIYTSGTSGEPRGVLLSHRNLYVNAAAIIEAFAPRTDRRLNFLPLSHIFARTCDWYVALVSGTEIGVATSRETILDDCQEFQPTVLNGVPYFFDKVRRNLLERKPNPSADDLKNALGGKVTLCNVGGAALPDHVFDFYQERGIALRQGYGLTEASPVVTLSTETSFRRGSVGKPIPGVEVQIAPDSEILTRGPSVMLGYWNDVAATTEAKDKDGWLHTGDLGHIDDEGYLFVTGRRKEIIALASGKKVHPAKVESLLTADPLILQACVIGEGKNFLTALLVPNPDVLRREIKKHRLWVFSRRGALRHRRVLEWFDAALRRTLADLAPWEQVKKFTLLGRGFTPESGELTPKLSLRREEIEKNLRAEIDAMYAATGTVDRGP